MENPIENDNEIQKPLISVILGSYNQLSCLQLVLNQYLYQTADKELFEVIVVDSSSTDGTVEFLKGYRPDYQFKAIIQGNQGKVAARHRAIQEACSEAILITDSDMVPHPELIHEHIEAQYNSEEQTCFEGRAFNMKNLHWPPKTELLYPQVQKNVSDGGKLGWYYFLTGNISFPTRLYFTHKGFDQDFKGYGWEDLELGYRLSKANVPIRYLKSAINYHYHVISEEEEIIRNVNKGESAQILLKKHPELKLFLGLNLLSRGVFPAIQYKGQLFNWVKRYCYKSKIGMLHTFGFWFLKEYYYMQGILNTPNLYKIKKESKVNL